MTDARRDQGSPGLLADHTDLPAAARYRRGRFAAPAGALHGAAPRDRAGPAFRATLGVAALLGFLAIALRLILVTPFPAPDELQHVSYAAYLQDTGRLLPRFEAQKTLLRTDLTVWTPRPNYIGHPSPFYLFEALFLRRDLPPAEAIIPLRLASLALTTLALLLTLGTGLRCLGTDRVAGVVFCAAAALCPGLLGVSQEVTNDSLAVLGGALAYCGAMTARRAGGAMAPRRAGGAMTLRRAGGAMAPRQTGGALLAAAGLLLAAWAKLNAGLEVGLLLLLVVTLQRAWRTRLPWVIAAGGLVGAIPDLLIWRDYGTLVPVTAESFANVPRMPDLLTYVPTFLLNICYTWVFDSFVQYRFTTPGDWLLILSVWAMILVLAWAAWTAWRRPDLPGASVAIAAPLVLALVVPVHLWFSARHLGGSLPAASFRYYLPLWPALAHGLGFAASRPRLRLAAVCVTGAVLVGGWAL
jgi:hypothetical protein